MNIDEIRSTLGDQADYLLNHQSHTFDGYTLHYPGADFVDRVLVNSDRSPTVLRSLAAITNHGRLAGTGYTSILPVDQGVEHSAGASFATNPMYFDPENIIRLAVEGGCSAVASTLGVLGIMSRRYVHKIPMIVKINHNELLSYPNQHDQRMFASIGQAWDLGAVAVGATIYFGSPESKERITEVSRAFAEAHRLGMATILWCYTRNDGFVKDEVDYHNADDLSSQAIHLGATIEADIVKQKLPDGKHGFEAIGFGKTDPLVYERLQSDHPIDLVRYQLANAYMGRVGLINSGGDSGDNDFYEAVRAAVINKRAGGMGMIMGRKAFKRPFEEGINLLHQVQDVYLCPEVTLA